MMSVVAGLCLAMRSPLGGSGRKDKSRWTQKSIVIHRIMPRDHDTLRPSLREHDRCLLLRYL
jgi:hypothetical protein